jgi:hypothetical protein
MVGKVSKTVTMMLAHLTKNTRDGVGVYLSTLMCDKNDGK